jgi:hypothetical protein
MTHATAYKLLRKILNMTISKLMFVLLTTAFLIPVTVSDKYWHLINTFA